MTVVTTDLHAVPPDLVNLCLYFYPRTHTVILRNETHPSISARRRINYTFEKKWDQDIIQI